MGLGDIEHQRVVLFYIIRATLILPAGAIVLSRSRQSVVSRRAQITTLGIRILVGLSLHPYLGYFFPVDVVLGIAGQLCYTSDPSIPVQVPLISTL